MLGDYLMRESRLMVLVMMTDEDRCHTVCEQSRSCGTTLGLRCWHLDKRRQYASVVAGELGWVLEGKEEERVAHSTTRMRVNVV